MDETIVTIKHLARTDTAIHVTIRPSSGQATDLEIFPGDEVVIKLEAGEDLALTHGVKP